MSFLLPALQLGLGWGLFLLGLTRAGREGDGWDFKGTQKGLKTPLRDLGAKLPSVSGLEVSVCPMCCPMREHSLSTTCAQACGVSELGCTGRVSLQSSLGR